jgi:hypothetical protein
MNPYCFFRNSRQACEGVGEVADRHFERKLARRPWNPYEADTTHWWLVPSTDWPAYQYGKYHFWQEGDVIFHCLHVEKGLGDKVRDVCPDSFIMNREWTWYRFLRGLRIHTFEKAIRDIAEGQRSPVEVHFQGGYGIDRGYTERESCSLHWLKDQERFQGEPDGTVKILKPLVSVKTFSDLASVLDRLTEDDWAWVEVFIALGLQIKPLSSSLVESDQLWSAQQIWDRFLCHLRPWIT